MGCIFWIWIYDGILEWELPVFAVNYEDGMLSKKLQRIGATALEGQDPHVSKPYHVIWPECFEQPSMVDLNRPVVRVGTKHSRHSSEIPNPIPWYLCNDVYDCICLTQNMETHGMVM